MPGWRSATSLIARIGNWGLSALLSIGCEVEIGQREGERLPRRALDHYPRAAPGNPAGIYQIDPEGEGAPQGARAQTKGITRRERRSQWISVHDGPFHGSARRWHLLLAKRVVLILLRHRLLRARVYPVRRGERPGSGSSACTFTVLRGSGQRGRQGWRVSVIRHHPRLTGTISIVSLSGLLRPLCRRRVG